MNGNITTGDSVIDQMTALIVCMGADCPRKTICKKCGSLQCKPEKTGFEKICLVFECGCVQETKNPENGDPENYIAKQILLCDAIGESTQGKMPTSAKAW